jgi:oligopeptide transport system substrate-binding protein
MQAIRIKSRWLVLLAALALVAAACNGEEDVAGEDPGEPADEVPPEEQEPGGEFTIHNCEPQSLIPANSTEVCGSKVLDQLFAGLVEYDAETSEPINVMAESIESEDQQTWTITIRDDFTFHNGEPVTAQSYADAWNFAVDPEAANQAATFFENWEGYDEVTAGEAEELTGVEVIDDTTIEVTLTEPFAVFPLVVGYTAFYPMPSEALEDIEAFEQAPIGNGRYRMDGEWEHDQQIAMVRNEDWPEDLEPGLADRIVWVIYADVNAAYLDVQAGNLDILDSIPPENEATVEDAFGENLIRTETSTFTYLGFPTYQPPFDNPDMRRAISMAIDRQEIIDGIGYGFGSVANSTVPPIFWQYDADAGTDLGYDPEGARRLLEEAGWRDRNGDGILQNERGEPFRFTMLTNHGNQERVDILSKVQSDLRRVGIQMDPQIQEWGTLLSRINNVERRDFDAVLIGWVTEFRIDDRDLLHCDERDQPYQWVGYCNPEVDQLLDLLPTVVDREAARPLWQRYQRLIAQDQPYTFLYFQQRRSGISDRLRGVEPDARGDWLGARDWWILPDRR